MKITKKPILNILNEHLINYPSPTIINYSGGFGYLVLRTLIFVLLCTIMLSFVIEYINIFITTLTISKHNLLIINKGMLLEEKLPIIWKKPPLTINMESVIEKEANILRDMLFATHDTPLVESWELRPVTLQVIEQLTISKSAHYWDIFEYNEWIRKSNDLKNQLSHFQIAGYVRVGVFCSAPLYVWWFFWSILPK